MLAKYHQPSPYSCGEIDLNTKTELKSVQALLGVHVRCQTSAPIGQMVFSGYSGFRPPLIKDRHDISEIFLIGS